jgi:ADP-ribose pyrophosphatase
MRETTLSITPAFQGRLLSVETLQVELEPGVRAHREIVRHPGAIAAVARLPDGRFVFVRQFRKAAERELLEIIAGSREPGEAPDVCATREIKEESGHDVTSLQPLGLIYPAPGYTDEVIHLYAADVSERRESPQGDPDERITVEYLTAEEFETLAAGGMIEDGKTLAAWLLFKLRRTP